MVVVVVITSEKVSDTTRLSSVYDRSGEADDCLKNNPLNWKVDEEVPVLDIFVSVDAVGSTQRSDNPVETSVPTTILYVVA